MVLACAPAVVSAQVCTNSYSNPRKSALKVVFERNSHSFNIVGHNISGALLNRAIFEWTPLARSVLARYHTPPARTQVEGHFKTPFITARHTR